MLAKSALEQFWQTPHPPLQTIGAPITGAADSPRQESAGTAPVHLPTYTSGSGKSPAAT